MKSSEQIDQIAKAMSLAQGEMKPASKSTVNPFFKSKYSTLAQIWEVIREPLSKNGLSVFQDVCSTETGISIATRVCHASGQWIEFGPLDIPLNKKDAQAVGSATSYGKRYALSAAIGVVSDEDDDGEIAMDRNAKSAPKPKEPEKHQEPAQTKKITLEEWTELNKLIDSCDEEFQKKVWDHLTSINIFSHEDMEEKMFRKIKASCLLQLQAKKAT